MRKRFLVALLLLVTIFLSFIAIRESVKRNSEDNNIIKKYNFVK